MSDLNYGVNVENFLYDLSQHDSQDIGEFDVYGENEQGHEGACSIDITLLASDALKLIGFLESQVKELIAENKTLDLAIGKIADANATGVIDLLEEAIQEATSCETPTTDKVINNIRAEGVDLYSDKIAAGSVVGNMLKLTATEFANSLRG